MHFILFTYIHSDLNRKLIWWDLSSREEVTFVYFKSLGMSQCTMKGVKIVDIDEDKCI